MAYPEEYYINAYVGANKLTADQERENRKKERKAFRAQYGCGGCWHRGTQVFDKWTCKLDHTAGPKGYCKVWFDMRSRKSPEELGFDV